MNVAVATNPNVISLSEGALRNSLNCLLAAGYQAGADLVEIFLESTDHLSLLVEQDCVTSVAPSLTCGAGIRVFRDKQNGFVSTNDLSEQGLLQALLQALDILGLQPAQVGPSGFEGLGNFFTVGKRHIWFF